MIHIFKCDNCGGSIETHCFDSKEYTYHTPPLPQKEITNEEELSEYFILMAQSAMTTLCDDCTSQ